MDAYKGFSEALADMQRSLNERYNHAILMRDRYSPWVGGFIEPQPPPLIDPVAAKRVWDAMYSPLPTLKIHVLHIPRERCLVRVKRHRKSRIDKKWRKRYGFKSVVDRTKGNDVFVMGNEAYCYPHVYEQLKKAIPETTSRFPLWGEKDATT